MNGQPASPNPGAIGPPPEPSYVTRWPAMASPRSWKATLFGAIVMIVLALLGVGLTTTNRSIAPTYWMSLVPVYGLVCVFVAFARKRRGEAGRLVLQQVFHWLAIAGAIGIDFYVRSAGEMTGEAAGLTALLLLALGCFLAGVHLEWPFALVGLFLAATLMLVVKTEQYMWLVLVIGAVIIAGMVWLMRVYNRASGRKGTTSHPSPVGS